MNYLLKSTARKIKLKTRTDPTRECPKRFLDIYKVIVSFGAMGRTQRKVAAQYKKLILDQNMKEVRKERAMCLKKTITSLTIGGNFSKEQFWKVRKAIYRKFESCSSVRDMDGREVFDEGLIRNAYQMEFSTRLSHRVIHPSLHAFEGKSNSLARMYVEVASAIKGPPISMGELNTTISTTN